MPGPFQMPPLPQLPFYIHPVLLWGILLVAAVLLAVSFFRFVFSEPGEKVHSFVVLVLVVLGLLGFYLIAENAPELIAFFRRLTSPIFRW
ncbi:MAG: hypothetical protein ROW48_00980 [Bellilinea sp.]